MPRSHDRAPDALRPVEILPGFVRTATGSALISCGETRVICTASVQESVPRWMAGKSRGWVTAEYGMLPASTGERKQRDVTKGRPDGRTVEIQRLIGRSLRGVIDFDALGERTIYLDCDVLTADGGTRCASITGAYVALHLACARMIEEGRLTTMPLTQSVAAVSCGMVGGVALLDLDYSEDSTAEVDANVVMTGDGGLVEVQATAERTPLSRASLDELLALAAAGIVDGVPLLDLDYSEDSTAEVDANVVMTGDGGLIEVQATAERTPLSRAHLDELLALAQSGIEALREAQAAAVA